MTTLAPGGPSPPKAIPADVVPFPPPLSLSLATLRSATSVQEVPSHCSVLADRASLGGVVPPKISPAVLIPPPA